METQEILLLLSLGIIVLWTTRLARSKGLNPWLWGVGALLLIAIAWQWEVSRQFLGPVVMAPLVFLLLFRSPLFRKNRGKSQMPCPSCGAPDTGGLNFCVQCGWDLSRTAPGTTEDGAQSGPETTATTENPATMEQGSVDTQPPPQAPAAEEPPPPARPEPTAEVSGEPAPTPETPEATPEPVPEPVREPVPEPVLAQEAVADPGADSVPAAAEPATPPAPAPPAVRQIPTPANLTERGIDLFNQGRFQEAIDQFTKAIALDANYREAWERRAEAYGRLGRPERQKADQRRLEAI